MSNSTARLLERAVPSLEGRTRVVHNGLPQPDQDPVRLPFDPPVLLALGRLIPEKGFDIALRACALVRRQVPEIQMIVAGDGPEREGLAQLAAELGLDVSFPGWVDPGDVPALINRATLVIVPSSFAEPFGLVALQASQMARPVVAARSGGLPEIISEGGSGMLFEAGDQKAAAAAIARLLADPELAARMGSEGRSRALGTFSMKRYADAYEEMYRGSAASPGAARRRA